MIFLSTLMVSVLLTALAVPFLSRLALRLSLVDVPNERKMHQQPVPRVGGLAMALGMVVPIIFWRGDDAFTEAFLAGAGVLVLFGLLDDCRDLAPRWKLLGQILAAAIAVAGGIRIVSLGMLAPAGFLLPGWFAIPFTIFVIVGVTNAINLSDGLDGLAGGISLLTLCSLSYLGYLQHHTSISIIALALAGATFGFLRYNTYPASIFMGDVGSQLLGYSCITLALSLTQGPVRQLSPVLPLILLGFPILDTLTVMVGRIARGISPFSADKTHFHHALIGLGLHHTESVMTIYLIQVTLIALALVFRFHSDRLLLAGYLAFSALVLAGFSCARRWNWQVKRMGPLALVDDIFLRLRGTRLITYLFRPLMAGLIVVLMLSALLAGTIPAAAASSALLAIAVLLLIAIFLPQLLADALKVSLYLLIPLVIYRSSAELDATGAGLAVFCYRLCFGALALLNILVSRLTRRIHGFQSTPLDFLVLFIALTASRIPEMIPEANLRVYSLGLIAAKIIICYFSCEVVFAELREHVRPMAQATLALLALLALRALW